MLFDLISLISSGLLYFALHLDNQSSFKKPLSAKQEREYFYKMKQGDEKARDILIEHNLRLVAHIIKKYYSNANDQEDLISIGTIGLIKAVNTFDVEKGARFATYASRCIENETLMHFRNIKKMSGEVFINDPIDTDSDGNSLTILDVVADEFNMVDNIDLKMRSEQLYKYIQSDLSERERQIIILRYGLGGYAPKTQREVSKIMKISRSYVSRIEKKALLTLRNCLEK